MEMEIDEYDILAEDPMKVFLTHQLNSIKTANKHLTDTINAVKSRISVLEAEESISSGTLIADALCKKFYNGKWCFIVDITSLDTTTTYNNFDVLFEWTPIIAPQYTLMIYSNTNNLNDDTSFVHETRIENGIRLVVIFESITFVKQKNYEADAMLFYNASSTKYRIKLPKFELTVDELNSGNHEIKNIHLIDNEQDAILAMLACSMQIKLALVLPMGVLKDYLVIDCMFRELKLNTTNYFWLNCNAEYSNGCLLTYREENGINLVTLYTRDREHLHNGLHYLHTNIPGVNIVPLRCKSQLKTSSSGQDESDDEIFSSQAYMQSQKPKIVDPDVKKFGECLLRQIDSVIDFHKNVVGNKEMPAECDVTEEYLAMRNALTEMESHTDALYRKFNK